MSKRYDWSDPTRFEQTRALIDNELPPVSAWDSALGVVVFALMAAGVVIIALGALGW